MNGNTQISLAAIAVAAVVGCTTTASQPDSTPSDSSHREAAIDGPCDLMSLYGYFLTHMDEIRSCSLVEGDDGVNLSGTLDLQWDLAADGSTTNIRVANSTLENHDIESCFVDVVAQMDFSDVETGLCEANYPLVVRGPGLVITDSTIGDRIGEEGVSQGDFCDPGHIQDVVRSGAPAIQNCYERQLLEDPELEGRITLSWMVLLDGSIADVHVSDDDLSNKSVDECIVEVIEEFEFDEPQGGFCRINYPFVFRRGQ